MEIPDSSIPKIENIKQFVEYKQDMLLAFDRYFPLFSDCLSRVSATEDLQVLPAGHEANPPVPGPMPDIPAANANADARAHAIFMIDLWKRRDEAYNKFKQDSRKICAFLVSSTEGEARIRLTDHADYATAYTDKNFRKIWKIILGLFVVTGHRKAVQQQELLAKIVTIKMHPREPLIDFKKRFADLLEEARGLNMTITDAVKVSSFVTGLSSEYQSLKEYAVTRDVQPTLQQIKDLAETWPIQKQSQMASASFSSTSGGTSKPRNKSFKDMSVAERKKAIEEDKKRIAQIECWTCKEKGHTAQKCPKKTE